MNSISGARLAMGNLLLKLVNYYTYMTCKTEKR